MPLQPPILAAHYAEIALKGKNRSAFLRRLKANIEAALSTEPLIGVNHVESRLLVRLGDPARAEIAAARLRRVFGIQWLSIATVVPRAKADHDLSHLCAVASELARRDLDGAPFFKIDARRSDRSFPLTSPEINAIVGEAVREATGLPVRLSQGDYVVHILVMVDQVLVFTRKIPGYGGLPVGTGGRVMALLSGGIDSPVAAFLMMKRGCRADCVHFYSGRNPDEADLDKIRRLAGILASYSPYPVDLYLVPSYPYELRAIGAIDESSDMVVFRRYMLKTAELLARRGGCQALVTGDSLGQVASQTIHNLAAIGPDVTLPVFRPVIGTDKHEISELARQIGTFDTSVEPYRDCCSIRSPHPLLRARPAEIISLSEQMNLDGAIEEAVSATTKEKIKK